MRCSRLAQALILLGLISKPLSAQEKTAQSFPAEKFAGLHQLIRPQPGEARWEQVSWMPANDIWAARQKAAEAGKPVLLWYMAGEPLGTC